MEIVSPLQVVELELEEGIKAPDTWVEDGDSRNHETRETRWLGMLVPESIEPLSRGEGRTHPWARGRNSRCGHSDGD